jgi:3',5'-cyclic AMP phosphodiesterase CpdA
MARWPAARAVCLVAAIGMAGCGGGAPPEQQQQQPPPAIAPSPPARPSAERLKLPKKLGSLRLAAIGDAGRGDQWQYDVSAQMQAYRAIFPFDIVLMLGDNVYDGGTPTDYRLKFELPYKSFLDAGVKFFATIGNHDDLNQPFYAPFNMGGERYYTVKPESLAVRLTGTNVRFFMVDTERLDRPQLAWIDREMSGSTAEWKIPVFHRPIYTSGRYALPAIRLRSLLEPVFVRNGVRVAFSGHEHFYERIAPQRGIYYFTQGGSAKLREGNIRVNSALTAKGYDTDNVFMVAELGKDSMQFQVVSRTGKRVDSGSVPLMPEPKQADDKSRSQ